MRLMRFEFLLYFEYFLKSFRDQKEDCFYLKTVLKRPETFLKTVKNVRVRKQLERIVETVHASKLKATLPNLSYI